MKSLTKPTITPKQHQLLQLLYRYRFLTRIQIQQLLHHTDKKRINAWLKDLYEKHYLGRIYSKTYGENAKPAIYYMALEGIRFLKKSGTGSDEVLKKLYRDKERSSGFISQCLLLADISLTLYNQTTEGVSFITELANDFMAKGSPFHFLESLRPHLLFIKQEKTKKTPYLLEYFPSTLPKQAMHNRLKAYIKYYFSNTWENNRSEPFPILLFICPATDVLIYAKWTAKKLLTENQSPDDLHLRFTLESEIRQSGVTSEIWEEARQF